MQAGSFSHESAHCSSCQSNKLFVLKAQIHRGKSNQRINPDKMQVQEKELLKTESVTIPLWQHDYFRFEQTSVTNVFCVQAFGRNLQDGNHEPNVHR